MGWTLLIQFRQKNGWRAFAEANNLRYSKSSLFASPEVSGIFKGYTITVFGSEHPTDDQRSTRKLSAVEILLKTKLPMDFAFGSGGMVPLIRDLEFTDEIKPNQSEWRDEYIASSSNTSAFQAYATLERVKALGAMMGMKNSWVIFIGRNNETLLRLDTPDPFESRGRIQKLAENMIKVAKVLELKEGEAERLGRQKVTDDRQQNTLAAPEEVPEGIGLELEEEPAAAEEAVAVFENQGSISDPISQEEVSVDSESEPKKTP